MKIEELKLGTKNIKLKAKVVEMSEPRQVRTKYGYNTVVATATLEDDTGKILLTLWGKKIKEINVNDTVEIEGGFISEFKGELQLNVPKNGTLKVV